VKTKSTIFQKQIITFIPTIQVQSHFITTSTIRSKYCKFRFHRYRSFSRLTFWDSPLITKVDFSLQMSIFRTEIFQKGMRSFNISISIISLERSNQKPFQSIRIIEISSKISFIICLRLSPQPEFISNINFPRINHITLATRPFSSEFFNYNIISFLQTNYLIIRHNFIWIITLLITPDRKQDSSFSLGIYLYSEITLCKTYSHSICSYLIVSFRHKYFIIKPFDFLYWLFICKMHRRTSSSKVRRKTFFYIVQVQV
ncbi:hypothetical protein IMG5_017500, partial [Ichthyophthirius multifiliis]